LISYLSIESIDDYRDDSIDHTLPRVASPAMPKPVLLQFAVNDSQLTIVGHFSRAVHLQRIRAGLRNTRHSRRSTSPRQFKSRLPSTRLSGVIYVTDDVRSLPQRLRKSYKAIYGSIDTVQDSGAVIADRASALNGKYINP
jgi:hypothetical protein